VDVGASSLPCFPPPRTCWGPPTAQLQGARQLWVQGTLRGVDPVVPFVRSHPTTPACATASTAPPARLAMASREDGQSWSPTHFGRLKSIRTPDHPSPFPPTPRHVPLQPAQPLPPVRNPPSPHSPDRLQLTAGLSAEHARASAAAAHQALPGRSGGPTPERLAALVADVDADRQVKERVWGRAGRAPADCGFGSLPHPTPSRRQWHSRRRQ
jgi:hypothetical protein